MTQDYKISVYKIWWDGKDDLYVGSTKQKLSRRMSKHRNNCRYGKTDMLIYDAIRRNGYDFNYVLLESFMVSCCEDKRKHEQSFIDILEPNLNSVRAFTSVEQHKERHRLQMKEYNKINKEKLKKKQKIYIKKNFDRIRANSKIYNQKNRDKISIVAKKRYLKNKEKIKEMGREYREENRAVLRARKKEYYEKNKEKIGIRGKQYRKENTDLVHTRANNSYKKHVRLCDCGGAYNVKTKSLYTKHFNTKRHKNFVIQDNLFYLNLLPVNLTS